MAQAHLCLAGTQVWRFSARKTGKVASSQTASGEKRVLPWTLRWESWEEAGAAGLREAMLPSIAGQEGMGTRAQAEPHS